MRTARPLGRLPLAALCALFAALALAAGPSPARAQDCALSGGPNIVGQGDFLFLGGRFRLDCPGGVIVRADSAVNIQSLEEWYLIGNVSYQDTVKALEADWIHYQSRERYLQGRGDVAVTDLGTGSTVTGANLQYWRDAPARPEARVLVEGSRPRAVLRQRGPAGEPPDTSGPTVVDANVIELLGQDRFHATGEVEIQRGELRGFGDQARFSETTDRLELTGDARVEGEQYTLVAQRIDAVMTPANELERVLAFGAADLVSEQVRIASPELRVTFADGTVQRLIALGARRASEAAVGPDSAQAIATAEDFRLVADSIDALAGAERLDSLYAVGRAYGEQLQDTVLAELPELIRRDWARGDTIRAYFAAAEPPAVAGDPTGDVATPAPAQADTTGERVVLERMVIVGTSEEDPAQTLYRERDAQDPAAPPQINYLIALRITIRLEDGQVQTVEAEGPVRGLQLRPATVATGEARP